MVWGLHHFNEEIEATAEGIVPDVQDEALLTLLMAFRFPISGKILAERYVVAKGWRLDARDKKTIEIHLAARFTIWEVLEVETDRGLHLRDALTAETLFIHDGAATQSGGLRNYFLGWVVIEEPYAFLYATHPGVLRPHEGERVVSRLIGEAGNREHFSQKMVRNPITTRSILEDWSDEVYERNERHAAGPRVQNTSGDPLLLTEDTFVFDESDREDVIGRLCGIRGSREPHVDEDDATVISFTHSRPDDPMDPTIIAHVVLSGDSPKFVARTNSRRRASAMRKKIEKALGTLARHRSRVHVDPLSEALERHDDLPLETPEAAAIVRQYKEAHYERWLDELIPALGTTPRNAMKSEEGRGRLRTLLKSIEGGEALLPAESRFDVMVLYRELGMSYVE